MSQLPKQIQRALGKVMINIQIWESEQGQKYIKIYEVRAEKIKGETITVDRFLNKKEAEEQSEFVRKNYNKLYKNAWTREQIVWC